MNSYVKIVILINFSELLQKIIDWRLSIGYLSNINEVDQMRKMIWTAECKTGVEEIDSQHRLLFAISNELLDIENPFKQQDEIRYLLRHLFDYVEKHFKTEEEYFQKHNYPGFKEHHDRHEEIKKEITNTIKESKSMYELKDKLDTMLDNWIRVHVLIEDKKYSVWATTKNLIPAK